MMLGLSAPAVSDEATHSATNNAASLIDRAVRFTLFSVQLMLGYVLNPGRLAVPAAAGDAAFCLCIYELALANGTSDRSAMSVAGSLRWIKRFRKLSGCLLVVMASHN